jgi:cytosine permease
LEFTIGTVLAVWLYNNFVSWPSILNATLPPLGVILVLDYFVNRHRYQEGCTPTGKVDISALAGVVIGALVANLLPWGIASINAMVVAAICCLTGEMIARQGKRAAATE